MPPSVRHSRMIRPSRSVTTGVALRLGNGDCWSTSRAPCGQSYPRLADANCCTPGKRQPASEADGLGSGAKPEPTDRKIDATSALLIGDHD